MTNDTKRAVRDRPNARIQLLAGAHHHRGRYGRGPGRLRVPDLRRAQGLRLIGRNRLVEISAISRAGQRIGQRNLLQLLIFLQEFRAALRHGSFQLALPPV